MFGNKGKSDLLLWALAAIVGISILAPGAIQNFVSGLGFGGGAGITTTTATTVPQGTCDMTQKGTLQIKGLSHYSGEVVSGYADLSNEDGTQIAGATAITGVTALSTNVGMNTNVYGYFGNDNQVTGWDLGQEMWTKRFTYSYPCVGLKTAPTIDLYNESANTWTGYDDGTLEATVSYAIGSGATFTAGELKVASGVDACLADPTYPHQLGVCFTTVNSTVDQFLEYARPKSYIATIATPKIYNYKYVIGDQCYELPLQTAATICDFGEYRFGIVIKANSGQDPEGGTAVTGLNATVISYGYYKDDSGVWQQGWAFNSDTGTYKLVGLADTGKSIFFT